MKEIKILDVKVNPIAKSEAIEKIDEFIVSKKPHQICTVNPEYMMAAQKDLEFKKIINEADLCVADGAGLWWASRYQNLKGKSQKSKDSNQSSIIKERITGIDLVYDICSLASKKGYSIYLLGAGPTVAEQTALILKSKYPNLKIAGISEGIPQLTTGRQINLDTENFESNLAVQISKLNPQILLVAYGAPKQDKFIYKHKKILNIPVMMGVGGSFDFISGRIKRAPKWMQKMHLEWLYRLINQPSRINRIITATIRFPIKVLFSK